MAGSVVEVTDSNFKSEVLESKTPVLIDFWASWCAPCKAIAPHVEALAGEKAGKLKVGKLDVDENQQMASQFGVRSIPTLILFKNGQPADQVIGAVSKAKLEEFVMRHI